jgi:hypothetical protein
MKEYEQLEFVTKNPRPTHIWTTTLLNHEEINNEILETIKLAREKNPKGYTDDININVWQSGWDMEDQPGFSRVASTAKSFTKQIASEKLNFPSFNPKLLDCWCNVYTMESGCAVHSHFPSVFSLVYYVSVPKNSGRIFFPDIEIHLEPTPGLLLCFKGDVWHGVEFNRTGLERIIIGMNVLHDATEK